MLTALLNLVEKVLYKFIIIIIPGGRQAGGAVCWLRQHDTWLKIKQESAGWPEESRSREEKQAYIRDYYEKEGT